MGQGWRRGAVLMSMAVVLAATGCSSSGHSASSSTSSLPGCRAGAASAAPGTRRQTLTVDGQRRWYRQFIPSGAGEPRPGHPDPVVIDLHGYLEGADLQAAFSGWEAKGRAVGAVVLTPQGQGQNVFWNVSGSTKVADDLAFLRALIDQTERSLCVDRNRIYVDGLSNGAMMTSLLACRLADRLAAFGTVAGLLELPDCHPSQPVPIIVFHGTADPFVPFGGGSGPGAAKLPFDSQSAAAFAGIEFRPIREVAAHWARLDGCRTTPTTTTVVGRVARENYRGCRGRGAVELYVLSGDGHTWPGSRAMVASQSITGPVNLQVSATDLMWRFFQAHSL